MKKAIIAFIVCMLFLSTTVSAQETDNVSASSMIKITLNEFGIEAAKIKFREIYAEKKKYSISQSDFLIRGHNLRLKGKTKEAIAVFNMTIELSPNSDQAYLELGRSYRSLGLDDKDLESTNRAFEIRNTKRLNDFISNNNNSMIVSILRLLFVPLCRQMENTFFLAVMEEFPIRREISTGWMGISLMN